MTCPYTYTLACSVGEKVLRDLHNDCHNAGSTRRCHRRPTCLCERSSCTSCMQRSCLLPFGARGRSTLHGIARTATTKQGLDDLKMLRIQLGTTCIKPALTAGRTYRDLGIKYMLAIESSEGFASEPVHGIQQSSLIAHHMAF